MKRGLVLAKYSTLAATTRQRFVQAVPYLKQAGISLDIRPLFDNDILTRLFTGRPRSTLGVARAYSRRMRDLLVARDFDFLWVHLETFPYLPGFTERLVEIAGKPVIYDYDDAIFHQYDQHPNPIVRRLLGAKLVPLMRRADIAFCGNAYLRSYADRYCARTELIPTTVDVVGYRPRGARSATGPVTAGWIGSPSTWPYCEQIAGVLADYANAPHRAVLIVGAQHAVSKPHPFQFRDWAETREVADIHEMDIGIMPVPDEPWARGKCGYKLIQYMACAIPVVASPVGVNKDIVEHGVNGFLASSDAEWRGALNRLAADPALRKRMGDAGRTRVEERYSIQRYGPRMAELIHSL